MGRGQHPRSQCREGSQSQSNAPPRSRACQKCFVRHVFFLCQELLSLAHAQIKKHHLPQPYHVPAVRVKGALTFYAGAERISE